MPRPLNWIRGEGTTKNQRWAVNGGFAGLGQDDGSAGDIAAFNNSNAIAALTPQVGPNMTTTPSQLLSSYSSNMGTLTNYTPLIIAGVGILALVLLTSGKRR